MSASLIHPTAIISPDAHLAPTVRVGPYAVVEAGVKLGECVVIGPHAIIHSGTTLKAHVQVGPHAVIGGLPQAYNFDAQIPSFVEVGERTIMREGVTVHRAMLPAGLTAIGADCFLMAYSHVGHDYIIGQFVTLTNNVMLGGFAQIGDFANLGGGAAIHQKVRVGKEAMVGCMSTITVDTPPYVLVADRNLLYGLNLVGLKRRGATQATIGVLKQCFKDVYSEQGDLKKAAARVLESNQALTPESRHFLEFFLTGDRGFVRPSS